MHEQLLDFLERHEPLVLPFLSGAQAARPPEVEGAAERRRVLGDRGAFTRLRALLASGDLANPVLRRRAEVLHGVFLRHQGDAELERQIEAAEAAAREPLAQARFDYGTGPLGFGGIWRVFRQLHEPGIRRLAWSRLREVAQAAAPHLLEAAALRNRAARELGFEHHQELEVLPLELSAVELDELFQKLSAGTEKRFQAVKADLDQELAARYKTRPKALGPWHYPHPFRLVPTLHAEGEGPRHEDAAAIELFLRKAGIPLPHATIREVLPRKSRDPATTDPWERFTSVASSLRLVVDILAERLVDPGLPVTLRRPAPSILRDALWRLFLEDLAQPSILGPALGTTPGKVAQVRARFLERQRRHRTVVLRHGILLWRLERALAREPGQDLSATFAALLRETLDLDLRDDAAVPFWAALPELHEPTAARLEPVLAVLAMEQLVAGLPPVPEGRGRFEQEEMRDIILREILQPGISRPWTETVLKISGRRFGPADALARVAV